MISREARDNSKGISGSKSLGTSNCGKDNESCHRGNGGTVNTWGSG